jgi:predicted amidophosphoribosyltransferase
MIVVIKCERCGRPFGSYAKRCPDCGWRSRYWVRSFLVRLLSIVGAIVALVTTYKMAQKQLEIERAIPKVVPTRDQLATPPPIEL